MYKGIDISQHNGYVDMAKVRGAGYDFVIIRDGYGDILSYPGQKDPRFEDNYANAKAAGLGVGAYHYLYATTAAGAKREAEGFIANISGKKFDYPIALDIEESTQYNLSNGTVEAMIKAFMDVCEKAGYYCLLYSYESFLTAKTSAAFRAKYDTWVANTTGNAPSIAYGIWQYSFNGSVPGCSSRVDMDRTEKDYPSLIKRGGFNGYPKEPAKPLDDVVWYKKGDKDKDGGHGIYAVKQRLKSIGYKVDDTGGFGDGTEHAIKDLQRIWGYRQTGEVGENFVRKIME